METSDDLLLLSLWPPKRGTPCAFREAAVSGILGFVSGVGFAVGGGFVMVWLAAVIGTPSSVRSGPASV